MNVNIVYQDIERSKYKFTVDDITFYFSSLFNLGRFKDRYIEYIRTEEKKIVNKYHFSINMKNYLLICFYLRIEKRGFLVEIQNKRLNKLDLNFVTDFIIFNEV